jgi:glycine dehydrogenase subunit 1
VFNELVVRSKREDASDVLGRAIDRGVIAGVDLGRFKPEWRRDLLVATTELHTRDDLDRLLTALTP